MIHAGFGIVYAPLEISDNAVGFSPNTGFSSSTSWNTSLNGGLNPNNLLHNPYPQGLVSPRGSTLGAGPSLGQSISVWDAHAKTPITYQWNFGVERQLPANLKVDASYIGTRGLHLTSDYQLDSLNPSYLSLGTALQTSVPNPFQPYVKIGALSNATITRQQLLLPYPQFTGVLEENATWGGSNYQAAQVKINKLPTHGVSFLVAYTFSKWMSNVPSADAAIGTTNSTGVHNYYDLAAENSLSEDDFPQSLIVNVVADLSFGVENICWAMLTL